MADSDFSVYARIQADTSNFEKGMKKAQASATNLSNTFGNLSKVIKTALSFTGVVVGTKALVDFGKASVTAANQANKQFRVLDNTIKATGADAWTSSKEMETLSKSLSDSTNYSVTEIQKMQSVLLGFRDITGETFTEASNAILDMSTVMGMDLTSAVQTVGKALDDPVKGLDSLRRQGFAFTDEQKAELAQLVKTGDKMKAQKIILDELSKTYGGAAKAGQDSFAKQRHAAESLSETLGNKLMPTVKYFAEENSKMFGSMQNLIENIDFNQISATVIAAFSTMKDEIKTLSAPFKSVGEDLKGFVSNINLKPFVSVLETLIGAFKRINEININSGIKNIKSLKEVMSGIGENIDLNKVADVINEVINGFVFLYEQVSKVFDTLRDNVKTLVSNIWNSIKSVFEASNKSLADSERDIKSWSDYFYSIFNSLYKNVQNLINLIDALLKGDWKVAWSYAKLIVLEIIDSIMTSLDTLVRGFADKIEKIVSTVNIVSNFLPGVLKVGAKEIATALTGIKKLTEGSGNAQKEIKNLISKTEKEITDATGKPANQSLEDLKNYVTSSEGVLGQFVDNFKEATEEAKKELEGIGQYTPPALGTPADAEENAGEVYSIYSEWDSKLLQQRQENLKEWEDEYHKINLSLIEEERKKAIEDDTTGKDRLKIEEYYNKEIEKENKRSEEAKRKLIKETLNAAVSSLKNFASTTVSVMKNVVNTIKNIFSKVGNIFTKVVKFNPDEALDNLLQFEDEILTFFTETVHKLPNFFSSAFQSISVLIKNIFNLIDFDTLSEIGGIILDSLGDLITNVAGLINKNSEKLTKGFVKLVKTVVDAVSKWVKSGGWKELLNLVLTIQKSIEEAVTENIEEFAQTIEDMLPDLINTLIQSIVSASQTLGKLAKVLLPLVGKLITAIVEVITSDEVVEASIEAVEGLVEGLIPAIVEILVNALPKIINFFLFKLPSYTPQLVIGIINGIINAFSNMDFGEVVSSFFDGFINGLSNFGNIGGLGGGLSNLFSKVFSLDFWTNSLGGLGDAITGIISSVLNPDFWSDILGSFGDILSTIINSVFGALDLTSLLGLGGSGGSSGGSGGLGLPGLPGLPGLGGSGGSSGGRTGIFGGFVDFIEDTLTGVTEAGKGITGGLKGTPFDPNPISNPLMPWNWFANGSDNVSKGLAIVGEAGPELVNFRGGEQVLNAHNTRKALEGMNKGNSVFNVTFNNTKDTTAYAMMSQLKQYNRQLAINGIL